jgi:hypothetical protein
VTLGRLAELMELGCNSVDDYRQRACSFGTSQTCLISCPAVCLPCPEARGLSVNLSGLQLGSAPSRRHGKFCTPSSET